MSTLQDVFQTMKLFLAGVNAHTYLNRSKAIYVLESFYYLQKNREKKEFFNNVYPYLEDFLLDSGAFTFMNSPHKNLSIDDYFKDYINFINQYDIKHFFELDVDSIMGLKQVELYRKILEKETGKKSIPVWHFSRGKEYWIDICKAYDYIAYGGINTDGVPTKTIVKYLPWFLETAKKYNCKVHLLGFTPSNILDFDAYSCDSTSWVSGSRFGAFYFFDGKKIKNMNRKTDNKIVGDCCSLNQHNLDEWIKYQKYLDNLSDYSKLMR